MATPIATASVEYVRRRVNVTVAGSVYNPTADTVKMAFTNTYREPVAADWKAASWETVGTTYYAMCLVGPPPGLVQLTPGTWFVWVQPTDNPEVPVIPAGTIDVGP